MSDSDEDSQVQKCALEPPTRLSESILWTLQRNFYDQCGSSAWGDGIVPSYITSNCYIAKSYAQMAFNFMKDHYNAYLARKAGLPTNLEPMVPEEPIYLFELGSGHGKFSFLFLKKILDLKATCPFPILQNFKYIMTDFTNSNISFWESQPAFKPFIEQGILDFAIFDATHDKTISLRHSNVTITPGSLKNPIMVVANYVFDTLPHDAFQIEDGKLCETLVICGSTNPSEPKPDDPEILKRLSNKWENVLLQNDNYYEDEFWNKILTQYRETMDEACVLIPVGGLRCVRNLLELSSGRMLLLSGDKGHNHPSGFRGISDPHIAVHGSFSMMVNYHALGVYFKLLGGFPLHTAQHEASLKCSAFVLGGPQESFCETLGAFNSLMEEFGPNDYFVLQKCMKDDCETPSLRNVLALIKLSGFDSDTYYKFRDVILDQISSVGSKLRADVSRAIEQVWQHYYLLDKDKDVAFEIGRYYYGIKEFDKALEFYTISTDVIGEHHVTYHNMGLCYYSQAQLNSALTYFEKSLALKSDYTKALSWRDRVRMELAGENENTA